MSGRPQQTCGTSRVSDAGGREHVDGGQADLGMVVVGERVGEEHHARG